MKYTKYFGLITKEQGLINLTTVQFQRMMNIVHVEGVLLGLNKIKETHNNTNQYFKYDMTIFKQDNILTELTGNLSPDLLLKEMCSLSN